MELGLFELTDEHLIHYIMKSAQTGYIVLVRDYRGVSPPVPLEKRLPEGKYTVTRKQLLKELERRRNVDYNNIGTTRNR